MIEIRKIWRDWKLRRHSKDYDNRYSYWWENNDLKKVSWYVWASINTKDWEGNYYIISNVFDYDKPFKTKEQAMLKAQELILKQYKIIKQSMIGR